DALAVPGVELAARERAQPHITERDPEALRDLAREVLVALPREEHERLLRDGFHLVVLRAGAVVGFILAPGDPTFFDRRRDALGQRARGHVARHHRTGAGVRAVADLDGSHQHGVGPGPGV